MLINPFLFVNCSTIGYQKELDNPLIASASTSWKQVQTFSALQLLFPTKV
jgi:hypothetical protein